MTAGTYNSTRSVNAGKMGVLATATSLGIDLSDVHPNRERAIELFAFFCCWCVGNLSSSNVTKLSQKSREPFLAHAPCVRGDWLHTVERHLVYKQVDNNTSCIGSDCLIWMADGTRKRVIDVRAGDLVMAASTTGYRPAKVECCVHHHSICCSLYEVTPGCRLTAFHPFQLPLGQNMTRKTTPWLVPQVAAANKRIPKRSRTVCNFVLEPKAFSVLVGPQGVRCISLGHGLREPTVQHPLWGTDRIRKCLRRHIGYPLVVLHGPDERKPWDPESVSLAKSSDAMIVGS